MIKRKSPNQKSKSRTPTRPHISHVRCPEGMTLEQWQRELRRQVSEEETLNVLQPIHAGEYAYDVRSLRSHRKPGP